MQIIFYNIILIIIGIILLLIKRYSWEISKNTHKFMLFFLIKKRFK